MSQQPRNEHNLGSEINFTGACGKVVVVTNAYGPRISEKKQFGGVKYVVVTSGFPGEEERAVHVQAGKCNREYGFEAEQDCSAFDWIQWHENAATVV